MTTTQKNFKAEGVWVAGSHKRHNTDPVMEYRSATEANPTPAQPVQSLSGTGPASALASRPVLALKERGLSGRLEKGNVQAVASPRMERPGPGSAEDLVCINVLQNVELELSCKWSEGTGTIGQYTISGPPKALARIQTLMQDDSDHTGSDLEGVLSPTSPVTIAQEHRASAGVPAAAFHYCYIYPIHTLGERLAKIPASKIAQNTWAFVLMLGGYAYFDEDLQLIAVNAIILAPSATGLLLKGYPVDADTAAVCVPALKAQKRLAPTLPAWRNGGFRTFCWLHSDERIEGRLLGKSYEHGAFLYETDPTEEDPHTAYLYVLSSVSPEAYKKAYEKMQLEVKKMTATAATEEDGRKLDRSLSDVPDAVKDPNARNPLSVVTVIMTDISTKAQNIKEKAGELQQIERTEAPEVPVLVRLRDTLISMLILIVYLGVGVLFYSELETEWSMVDSLYFSVVTMSTVGYGDLSPSKPNRAFTAFYLVFGVTVVLNRTGQIYSTASHVVGAKLGLGDLRGDPDTLQPAWLHYLRALGLPVLAGTLINIILFAYLFTITENGADDIEDGADGSITMGDALWHCVVTCTTVGYGDIGLTTKASKGLAVIHIVLSVSWLAHLLQLTVASIQQRAWDLQRFEYYRVQLSEDLINKLDYKRDGKVNEVEFVVGMIIALGAEVCGEKLDYHRHVVPLTERFKMMDDDGNGYLDEDDLRYLVKEAQEANVDEMQMLEASAKSPQGNLSSMRKMSLF